MRRAVESDFAIGTDEHRSLTLSKGPMRSAGRFDKLSDRLAQPPKPHHAPTQVRILPRRSSGAASSISP